MSSDYFQQPTLDDLLERQRQLQLHMKPPRDPGEIEHGEEFADFIVWNTYALIDELSEAMSEVRWKPWANDRGYWVHRDNYVSELVDAMHFLFNLFLIAGVSPGEVAQRYLAKVEVNIARQQRPEGYDAVANKDDQGRALDEPHRADPTDMHRAEVMRRHTELQEGGQS